MIKKIFIVLLLMSCYAFANSKVLIVSSTIAKTSQNAKLAFLKKESVKLGLSIECKFVNEISKNKEILSEYDLVLFDALTGSKHIKVMLESFGNIIPNLENKVLPMLKDENPYMKNITKEQRDIMYDYWQNGGVENIQNMIKYIKNKVLDNKEIEIVEPKVLPLNGIYHPRYKGLAFNSTKEYLDFLNVDLINNKKPIIAVYFGRNSIVANILGPINDAIKLIEDKGGIALPFYFRNPKKDDSIGLEFLQYENKTIANAMLYFFSYVMDNGDKKRDFKKLNIPILHALYYREGDQEKWEKDKIGMPLSSIAGGYIMPESLGFTDSLVIATQNKNTKEFQTIPYQMESFVNKAFKLSKLQTLNNADKKVVLMYYALGRDKIGASFLNVHKSIESIFKKFKEEGYTNKKIDEKFIKEQSLKTIKVLYDVDLYGNADKMLKEGQADLYPYEDYMKEFYKLPVNVRTDMIRKWGYALKSKMLIRKNDKWYFLIPRVQVDNIIFMPQPLVGERNDSIWEMNMDIEKENERDWHNPNSPISHSYFATYLYLKNQFKANAIIHLGTHGTVEWSLGKQRGLSIYDSPLMSLSDVPHFYPYIANNTAETIQVRRRGRGVIISHQTPAYSLAGAYNEIDELMELVAQYRTVTKGLMQEEVKKEIVQKAMAINLHKDIQSHEHLEGEESEEGHDYHEKKEYLTKDDLLEDFEHFVHELEHYLQGITGVAQPLGSHTFGTTYEESHLITTIIQMIGKEFLVQANGENYASKNYKDFDKSKAYTLIKEYCLNEKEILKDDLRFKDFIEKGKHFHNLLVSQKENINLFRALNGEHIEGGTGGGPIRNPQSLPTGINLVSFDPTKVPTEAAYKTGKILMEDFIANYYKKNKKYPNKITFNLWGLETVRHHGVLESQLLAAIGVKPIRDSKGKIKSTEIIPFKDLKRPRIDVVVSATGLYRDMYPNTIKLIAKAIKDISELKEEGNFLRNNSLSLFDSLLKEKNIDEKEAKYLSSIRIFSSKTGNYGSGIEAIQETSRWKNDKRITKDYLEHTGYYFGTDEKRWNEKNMNINLYSRNLSGTNAVVFSRTSNLYGLLSSADPYSHFGSIGMAIRNIDGKTPDTYISNLRDPKNAKIQTTQGFMNEELRGRYFHPNWISEMQKEDYAGAVEISSTLNNFWGWQVVNPDTVRSDQWDEFKNVYVDDKYKLNLQEWFKEQNPQALQDMVEKMIEAYRKNYWKTSTKNIKELLDLQEELEKNYDTNTYNTVVKQFREMSKVGFGLDSLREGQKPKLQIKGQKLEKQKAFKDNEKDNKYLYIILFLSGIMLSGIIFENRNKKR